MEESDTFSAKDWVVHSNYGIGQIKAIEVKGISGEESSYYRIQTSNSTFWMPVDKMDSDLLRALSTPEEIREAVAVVQRPPKEMSSDFRTRQGRIRKARMRNRPKTLARLVRDLRARRQEKGVLNSTELSAFHNLKKQLAEEWAIVMDIKTEVVQSRLDDLLNLPQPPSDGQGTATAPQE